MTDAEKIRQILDEMEPLEARVEELKRELRPLLGLPESDRTGSPDNEMNDSPTPPRREHRGTVAGEGAVAKGTRGRQVIEIVYSLGGKARAVPIAERMTGIGPRKKAAKKVRTYIYSLSHAEPPYLEKATERGEWRLTGRAYEVLGKAPLVPRKSAAPMGAEG